VAWSRSIETEYATNGGENPDGATMELLKDRSVMVECRQDPSIISISSTSKTRSTLFSLCCQRLERQHSLTPDWHHTHTDQSQTSRNFTSLLLHTTYTNKMSLLAAQRWDGISAGPRQNLKQVGYSKLATWGDGELASGCTIR